MPGEPCLPTVGSPVVPEEAATREGGRTGSPLGRQAGCVLRGGSSDGQRRARDSCCLPTARPHPVPAKSGDDRGGGFATRPVGRQAERLSLEKATTERWARGCSCHLAAGQRVLPPGGATTTGGSPVGWSVDWVVDWAVGSGVYGCVPEERAPMESIGVRPLPAVRRGGSGFRREGDRGAGGFRRYPGADGDA